MLAFKVLGPFAGVSCEVRWRGLVKEVTGSPLGPVAEAGLGDDPLPHLKNSRDGAPNPKADPPQRTSAAPQGVLGPGNVSLEPKHS